MKIRCTHNSIRYRLRKSDIAILQAEKIITESVGFGGGVIFQFSLLIHPSNAELSAQFENQHLQIMLPTTVAEHWIRTNEVGIERYLSLGKDQQLHLLIEKDFPCLDRAEENRADTFWELAPDEPDNC